MLEKVPQIPILTEDQQKAAKPGYYQVAILGIEDNESKFELTRTRKTVNRGRNSDTGDKPKTTKKASEKLQSKPADKGKATLKNLANRLTRKTDVFKNFDKDSVEADSGEFDSDDSTKDPTLISENHVKVLKSSLKNLKKKLLEKCKENEELEKRLQERDAELTKLRELNRGLQENLLQRMTAMLSSATSSRSSSLSSLNLPRSLPGSPLCSRSRSVSTSSSCSGIHSRGPSPLAHRPSDSPQQKRKTPPTTPQTSGFKRALHKLSHEITDHRLEKESPSKDTTDSISRGGSFDDSSSTTVLNDSTNTTIREATDESLNATEGMDTTETGDTQAEENESLVQFCKGYKVDKLTLKNIEARALGKVNDSSYVKELAVAVFGLKVLYNSSLSERRYSRSNENNENQKTRKKLDETALSEIADRLKKRVFKEFNGAVPEEAFTRYRSATVNRYIYDKIKRMRQTENYRSLEDKSS